MPLLKPLLNPTQIVGILSFWSVAFASARTARRLPREASGPWVVLSVLYVALGLEVIFGLRHKAHDWVNDWLVAHGLYASRGEWQADLVLPAAMGVVAVGVAVAIKLRRSRSNISLVAWAGTVAILCCFVVETISLHEVDAVMYFPVGPFLIIAFWWAGASAVVAASAVSIAPHHRVESRKSAAI